MRKITFIFLLMLATSVYGQDADQRLGQLLNASDFFGLQEAIPECEAEASEFLLMLAKATAGYYFNDPEGSLEAIKILFEKHSETLGANSFSMAIMMAQNHVALQNYKEAVGIYESIISKAGASLDAATINGFTNALKIYKGLSGVPPQKITLGKTMSIPLKRDKIGQDKTGLITVPVKINDWNSDFVFDTGANYSMVPEAYAKDMGLRILADSINTGGIGGNVFTKVAVADRIHIGDIIIENVIFLVLPDKLKFSKDDEYEYEIKGIIGIPVMLAMGEIHFYNDSIIVPMQSTKRELNNLMLDGLVPLVKATSAEESLLIHIDTGAKTGGLSYNYYEKHKDGISQEKTDTVDIGGLGGEEKSIVVELNDFPLQIGNGKTTLPMIHVHKDQLYEMSLLKHDGTVGLDFMERFDKMIINFKDMYVDFE